MAVQKTLLGKEKRESSPISRSPKKIWLIFKSNFSVKISLLSSIVISSNPALFPIKVKKKFLKQKNWERTRTLPAVYHLSILCYGMAEEGLKETIRFHELPWIFYRLSNREGCALWGPLEALYCMYHIRKQKPYYTLSYLQHKPLRKFEWHGS